MHLPLPPPCISGTKLTPSPEIIKLGRRSSDYRNIAGFTCQIEVNQDYAGHSGSQFAQSTETVTLHACDWKAGVSCDWPKWTAWHKPLSGTDTRKSTGAILLMNNDYEPTRLSFSFADVPGMAHNIADCEIYDVWARTPLGKSTGPTYTTKELVASHDSIFLTLSGCRT